MSLRTGDPIEAVLYRMEAIKIINGRLSVPQQRTADATIAAVAALANYEVGIFQSCHAQNPESEYASNKSCSSFRMDLFQLRRLTCLGC